MCLSRNLHFDVASATKSIFRGSLNNVSATKYALQFSPNIAPATKSANEPHNQKSRFTIPITKSKFLDDQNQFQSATPTTKNLYRNEIAPIPCTYYETSIFEYKNNKISLPRKITIIGGNMCDTTMKTQSLGAPGRGTQIL